MGTDAAADIATRISGATADIATRVTGAIRDAARVTGAGFEYLLNTALRESNLNPNAKNKGSSATGLFQFIDQTWLSTMKQSGASLGYGKYADAISRTSSGRYIVKDAAMRDQIFALRKDPAANSLMAGAFANSNAKVLTERLGRKPTDGELYMAHFLGASGASRFIRAAEANPNGKAASLFPRAAHANSSVFYDSSGAARSLKQVYAGLVSRHNVIGNTQFADAKAGDAVQSASASTSVTTPAPLPRARPVLLADVAATGAVNVASASPTIVASNGADAAPAAATSAVASTAPANAPATFADRVAMVHEATAVAYASEQPQGPIFQSLYQSDQRGPVAPIVRELWGARHATSVETADAVAPATNAASSSNGAPVNAPLDLFRFLRPSARRPA
ncbi:MAG TPA: transglycosylase SLT domain-containing protein [Xanthobacteraceae bacterium]|jgi:hypothetical protein|nr:transglycosylase SLT domain-containing protein [Xanthobacteraceae bacterium]